jgi:NitT/TauT family transport system substrate-binding protein
MKRWRLQIAAVAAVAAVAALVAVGAMARSSAGVGTVRFQLSFFPNAQHVGFLVASNRGFYKAAGVNVKVVPGGPTVNPTLALAQGNVDIARPAAGRAARRRAPGTAGEGRTVDQ